MTTETTLTPSPTARLRRAARWMVTFAGFPLGGLAAMLLVGPVDGPWPALAGGALTVTVLTAVLPIVLHRTDRAVHDPRA
ncbi:hypothetical protein [Pseudonocardia sp. GCM10023141]|uniref:hypothetical protein n=1 Tax=Pseudonocardia sp. GCM10023141 TaxID=3252653 RepID=UPI00360F9A08